MVTFVGLPKWSWRALSVEPQRRRGLSLRDLPAPLTGLATSLPVCGGAVQKIILAAMTMSWRIDM